MVDRRIENIEVVRKTPLYEKFFKADEYSFKYPLFNGEMSSVVSREVMERGQAAGILLYDPDRDVLVLAEQIRAGALASGEYPWLLECVAGIIDPGETPEQVAVREAKEEAGASVLEMESVAEAEKMLIQGRFNNSMIIIAVQWLLMNKEKLRKKWGKL